ncbi:hypothetical protein [Lapillicoccus sp.]|uniref:hypothetical protein n=1 Tax=Lapillicoccus sp. TaxID=1909287 RepID=UPI003266B38D
MPARRLLIPTRPMAVGAALLAAAALSLGGCSTLEKAQSAAIVNGVSIPSSEVGQATAQLNRSLVTDPSKQIPEAQVVNLLVLSKVVLPLSGQPGFWVPDAQYNALLAKLPDASQSSRDVVATSLFFNQLQNSGTDAEIAVVKKAVQKATIELDPRFGTFDAASLGPLPLVNNWIKPTPSATASSTAPAEPPGQAPADTSTDSPTGQ